MRGSCAIAAALLLAACRVDVEGARCTLPGSPSECPDGQACGNDGRCSARAAGCGTSFCRVGATTCEGSADLGTCVADVDPVCGSWRVSGCGANLGCVERGAEHACECLANSGTEFAAGAGGSAVDGAAHPTGLANPPECRFKRLGDALAAAIARGGPATVKVHGDPGAAVVFTGEVFPLAVPPDVTISGADPPAGETVVHGDAGSADAMVALQGTLERVHLQNVSMTGNGVEMTCGGTAVPTARDVVVSAPGTKLAKGIAISGACGALLERVDASGAAGAALDIASDPTAPITAKGSKFHASGVGVQSTGGKVVLEPDPASGAATEVTDNAGSGLLLTGASSVVDATLNGVLVARNGGVGLFVDNVAQASKLRMTGCDVSANAASAPVAYGPVLDRRNAGGLLVSSQVLLSTFQLQANRIYANHGGLDADELAFESSAGPWPLTTSSCVAPALPNAIGCAGTNARAVSVTAPGTVDARFTIWPATPPSAVLGVNTTSYCGAWSGSCPP